MSRPKPIVVGPLRVRAARGPHLDDPARWYWQALRYEGGAQRCAWSGWATREGAERIVADIVARGEAPERAGHTPRDGDVRTVADLLAYYVEAQRRRKDIAPSTARNRSNSAAWLADLIGDVPVARMTTADLASYRDRAIGDGRASGSVVEDLRTLSGAWHWGRSCGVVSAEMPDRPPVRHRPARTQRTPTLGEVEAVIAVASPPWAARVLTVLRYTGARLSEAARLTWADVDLANAEIRVRAGKTGGRPVAIPRALVDYLAETPEAERTGRLYDVMASSVNSGLGGHLRLACEVARIEPFRSHDIRRAVIDAYYEAGVDVGVVAEQLGQSPRIALAHYRRATAAQRARGAALALDGRSVVAMDARRDAHNKGGS